MEKPWGGEAYGEGWRRSGAPSQLERRGAAAAAAAAGRSRWSSWMWSRRPPGRLDDQGESRGAGATAASWGPGRVEGGREAGRARRGWSSPNPPPSPVLAVPGLKHQSPSPGVVPPCGNCGA
ncbi:unnamed protein product [Boreogadus saida]